MFSLKVHPSIPFGKLFEIICFLYHFLRQHEFKAAENWIEQKKMKLAKKKNTEMERGFAPLAIQHIHRMTN